MAPSIFSPFGDRSAVKHLQIRLVDSNIVLRGSEVEAPGAILKGSLVLCLSDPIKIQSIKLRFTGERKIAWVDTYAGGSNVVKEAETFIRVEWHFKKTAETLPAGNYEWDFEMFIPGDAVESLEGLDRAWIVYRLKAVISRGRFSRDLVRHKQVRVIRLLSPDALEFSHSMSVENTWVNKLQYFLSTPAKAVVFGSSVRVDFTLIPLLKGLKIGTIKTELLQRQTLCVSDGRPLAREKSFANTVFTDHYNIPEDTSTDDIDGQEGYQFSRYMTVPRSLRSCVQSFEAAGIIVRHYISFSVRLHNPDGHVSELHANLPLHIILSPHIPIDDNHNLLEGTDQQMALAASELNHPTPPMYGSHHLDQLFNEIDTTGYNTPISASGFNTPNMPRHQSISSDELSMLRDAPIPEGVPVNALVSRLYGLAGLDSNAQTPPERLSPSPIDLSLPLNSNSGSDEAISRPAQALSRLADQRSASISGYPSYDPTTDTMPTHSEYTARRLTMVPSYATALQTTCRTPIHKDLPTYQAAVSRSNSIVPGSPSPERRA